MQINVETKPVASAAYNTRKKRLVETIDRLYHRNAKASLQKVPGVSAVKVDFAKKTAAVTYDTDKSQPDTLTQATTNAGYPSTVQK